jgi:hypothetical protein
MGNKPSNDSVYESNKLKIRIIENNNVLVKYDKIPNDVDTILFYRPKNTRLSVIEKMQKKIPYLSFLENIPLKVEKIIFEDMNLNDSKGNIFFNNLPPHIKYLELEIYKTKYQNVNEVLPHLNNLPINLKTIKINNLHHFPSVNSLYFFEEVNYFLDNEEEELLRHNIKIPFGCKIIPLSQEKDNFKEYDDPSILFFRAIYSFYMID